MMTFENGKQYIDMSKVEGFEKVNPRASYEACGLYYYVAKTDGYKHKVNTKLIGYSIFEMECEEEIL